MAEKRDFNELKQRLLARRRDLLDLRTSIRSSWQNMSEAEIELEESASKENAAHRLERFDHRGWEEILKIDEALTRMENGEYGICTSCGEPISYKRLEVLPWASECVECAEQREQFFERAPLTVAEQIEEDELNDDEIVDAIWAALEREDQIEKDGLAVTYTDGTVHLSGSLPSQDQHQMVIEIIHEEIGIEEVIDRIDIDELVYEEQEDTDEENMAPEDKKSALAGEDGPVDMHEVSNENQPLDPPDRFVTEDER